MVRSYLVTISITIGRKKPKPVSVKVRIRENRKVKKRRKEFTDCKIEPPSTLWAKSNHLEQMKIVDSSVPMAKQHHSMIDPRYGAFIRSTRAIVP